MLVSSRRGDDVSGFAYHAGDACDRDGAYGGVCGDAACGAVHAPDDGDGAYADGDDAACGGDGGGNAVCDDAYGGVCGAFAYDGDGNDACDGVGCDAGDGVYADDGV